MSRSQFVPSRLLLLALLLVVLPAYGLSVGNEGGTSFALASLLLGVVLFVWKWRWWWTPIREYVRTDRSESSPRDRH